MTKCNNDNNIVVNYTFSFFWMVETYKFLWYNYNNNYTAGVNLFMRSCFETCPFNTAGLTVDMLHSQTDTDFHTLKAKAKKNGENYQLSYAPVGNSPAEPFVIIVGKTPGLKTLDKFTRFMNSGISLEHAAFQSVYSEMKPALFKMLQTKTRFFDFMELVAPQYWKGKDKLSQWNSLFDDYNSSLVCGIQLTQSCNCCIHTSDSKEPSNEAMHEIKDENPECLFSSFIITDKLEIIIFLDTPSSDKRYHPECQYLQTSKAKELIKKNVMITSFPHPSGGSPATYDSIWNNPDKMKQQYPNVFRTIERTRQAFDNLILTHTNK